MADQLSPSDSPLAMAAPPPTIVWEMPPYTEPGDLTKWCNWLRANGIEPTVIARKVVITAGTPPMIHVAVYQVNERGQRYTDLTDPHERAVTVPHSVPLRVEPPGGPALMATPSRPEWLGRAAYGAYVRSSGRPDHKDWDALHPAVRGSWEAAVEAVYAQLLDDFDLVGHPAVWPGGEVPE
jgi:hypothetical protein